MPTPDPSAIAVPARPRRRPRRWIVVACLAAALAIPAGIHIHWVHVSHRLEEISPGACYKSSAMSPDEVVSTCRRLGVRTVIDLRNPGTDDPEQPENTIDIALEAKALAAAGIAHVNLPSNQVPDDAVIDRFLAIARDPAQRPLLIHCYHGTGRAELFSAIYRIEIDGWSNEDARLATRLLVSGSSFDTTAPKGRFLAGYRRRSEAGSGGR